jgi:thymidine kinase
MYGKLTTICGPMFAGKSTELLKRILWARNGQHKTVLVIKPAFDNRYSSTKIVTHDGLSVDAKSITKWDDIAHLAADAELICIDEIQFFTPQYFEDDIIECVRDCLIIGTEVVVGGLDMDWRGEGFETTSRLMAMSDEVKKITAVCTSCGQPASKTHKKLPNAEQIELGTTDLYEARCNDHWGM